MSVAIGTDDSVTTCDCCGRTGLKFTVVIQLDQGEVAHYGQVCAIRNTGKDRRTLGNEVNAYRQSQLSTARREYRSHPAYRAEVARLAERDALPWNDPRRTGAKAADFVRSARQAADKASAEIAARFNLRAWEVRA
jgi:alkylated DNA nucleotide flippase Atl1